MYINYNYKECYRQWHILYTLVADSCVNQQTSRWQISDILLYYSLIHIDKVSYQKLSNIIMNYNELKCEGPTCIHMLLVSLKHSVKLSGFCCHLFNHKKNLRIIVMNMWEGLIVCHNDHLQV